MDKLFQSTWFIRIISLALAITLYIFVTVESEVSQNNSRIPSGTTNEIHVIDEVPLDIKIDSERYVVSGVPEHVKVTLEGRMSVILPIARQLNFNVFVDLRELTEGEHTVEVEYENLPESVTAYIEPKTIDVVIEKRTAKEFTVDVDLVNEDKLPLGYEIGEPEVNPQTVTIISSQAIIDQIAMVKVFIDVTDLKESIHNRELPISVYDIQGNALKILVEPASVMVSLPVERPSKTVPLKLQTSGELAEDLEIESIELANEDIEIFGKRAILNEISELNTKPLDLAKIDKSGKYEVEIDFPEGVIANNTTVEVEVKLLKTRTFEDVSIDVEANSNLSVTIENPNDGKVNVQASGSDELIEQLKKADIRAFVRVNRSTEGREEVDLSLEGPDDVTLEASIKKITVSIE